MAEKSELAVPTVTEDDLRAFHTKHFASAPLPQQFFVTYDEGQLGEGTEEAWEEDDLGYYDDGVKRTLTDEQIAIFRHTEIQTLLREQRRKEEENEERESSRVELASSPQGYTKQVSANPSHRRRAGSEEEPSKSQSQPKAKRVKGKGTTAPKHFIQNEDTGQTYRRSAREMDEAREDVVELDY